MLDLKHHIAGPFKDTMRKQETPLNYNHVDFLNARNNHIFFTLDS